MGLINAIRFLTVLPIPLKREITERELGRSTAWFPLVGVLLGGLLLPGYFVFSLILSPLAVNAIVLVLWVLLTRGLHLDGLADTADGLGGGTNQDVKLAIMKDSRIGVFGVLAVFCSLVLKIVLLGELGGQFYSRALILIPALGRWCMVLAIFIYPSARETGMGQRFKRYCRRQEVVFASLTALVCVYFAIGLWGIALLFGLGAVTAVLSLSLTQSLGGLTGDTYGAICEIGEVLSLLGFSLLIKGSLLDLT